MVSRARDLADLIKANSSINVPAGSTSDQPLGDSGTFRLNTTNNTFEGYTTTGWKQFASRTYITANNAPSGAIDGDIWFNSSNSVISIFYDSNWIKGFSTVNLNQSTGTGGISLNSITITNQFGVPLNNVSGFSVTTTTSPAGYIKCTGSNYTFGGMSASLTSNTGQVIPITGTIITYSSSEIVVPMPVLANTGSYSLTLTNFYGNTVTLPDCINYFGAPTWITDSYLQNFEGLEIGSTYLVQLAATPPIVSYDITSGSVPTGFTFTANNGILRGAVPLPGGNTYQGIFYGNTSNFTVRATNPVNLTTSRNFFITAPNYKVETYTENNETHRYWIFENSGMRGYIIPPYFGEYDILMVGGGGRGFPSGQWTFGGGGGGGVVFQPNILLNSHTSYHKSKVSEIIVVGSGTGYSSTPTVTITPNPSQNLLANPIYTTATATAVVVSTNVNSIIVTNPGNGYVLPPVVTITGGSGSGASANAIVGGNGVNIYVGFGGLGSWDYDPTEQAQNGNRSGFGANTFFSKNRTPQPWYALGGGGGGGNYVVQGINGGAAPGGGNGGSGGGGGDRGGFYGPGSGLQPTQQFVSGFGTSGSGYGGGGANPSANGWGIYIDSFKIRGTNVNNNTDTSTRGFYGSGGNVHNGSGRGPGGAGKYLGSVNHPTVALNGDGIPGTGGGGTSNQVGNSGRGGSGIFIIRHKIANYYGDILLAAGGGNGGSITLNSANAGGGGGGGLVLTENDQFGFYTGSILTITIGGANSNSSVAFSNWSQNNTIIAVAGGTGGSSNDTANTNGLNGGSGGGCGGGSQNTTTLTGNTIQVSSMGYGYGENGFSGGGGGARANGTSTGLGGIGYTWINGVTYCQGGNEGKDTGTPYGNNTGGGGHGGQNGNSGVFVLRYLGSQRGLGGTITSSNGYTYHTFTSSGVYIA